MVSICSKPWTIVLWGVELSTCMELPIRVLKMCRRSLEEMGNSQVLRAIPVCTTCTQRYIFLKEGVRPSSVKPVIPSSANPW